MFPRVQEIEPFETKRVMQATFVGRVANNHTAFICIRTDQENRQQLLILPVEVEFCAGEYFDKCLYSYKHMHTHIFVFTHTHMYIHIHVYRYEIVSVKTIVLNTLDVRSKMFMYCTRVFHPM